MQAAWQYWILCIYIYCSIYGSARLHFINPRISKVWHIPYLYNSSNIFSGSFLCQFWLFSSLLFSKVSSSPVVCSQFLFLFISPQLLNFSSSSLCLWISPILLLHLSLSVSPLLHLSLSVSLLLLSLFLLFLFTSAFQVLFFISHLLTFPSSSSPRSISFSSSSSPLIILSLTPFSLSSFSSLQLLPISPSSSSPLISLSVSWYTHFITTLSRFSSILKVKFNPVLRHLFISFLYSCVSNVNIYIYIYIYSKRIL